MAKATSVHSTPPTNTPIDTKRRNFLSRAASGAVAAAIPTAALAAATAIDPIYAVIERHRKACREHHEAIDIRMDFEELGMTGEKLAKYKRLVAETDAAYDRLDEVGCDLINTKPTTLAGISGALSIHQPAIRRGRCAGPAAIYFVRRRHHGDPGRSALLCDRPGG